MKLSKEELKQKINGLEVSDEVKITLLEDIEDSMEVQDTTELDELKAKYEELKEKYKARFLDGEATDDNIVADTETAEELEEVEEIDVEEIFD